MHGSNPLARFPCTFYQIVPKLVRAGGPTTVLVGPGLPRARLRRRLFENHSRRDLRIRSTLVKRFESLVSVATSFTDEAAALAPTKTAQLRTGVAHCTSPPAIGDVSPPSRSADDSVSPDRPPQEPGRLVVVAPALVLDDVAGQGWRAGRRLANAGRLLERVGVANQSRLAERRS